MKIARGRARHRATRPRDQKGMIFFRRPFFFLLLERSLSEAGMLSSDCAVAEDDEDCVCWISLVCVGGGKDGSTPLSVGLSSLESAGAVGFNSLGSGWLAGAAEPTCPKGEAAGVLLSVGGAAESVVAALPVPTICTVALSLKPKPAAVSCCTTRVGATGSGSTRVGFPTLAAWETSGPFFMIPS